jgi:hypothetical protein
MSRCPRSMRRNLAIPLFASARSTEIRAYERLPFALTSSTLMLVGATATMTNALARDAGYRDDGELNLKELHRV